MITQYTAGTIPTGNLFQPGAQIAIYALGEAEEPPPSGGSIAPYLGRLSIEISLSLS